VAVDVAGGMLGKMTDRLAPNDNEYAAAKAAQPALETPVDGSRLPPWNTVGAPCLPLRVAFVMCLLWIGAVGLG